MYTAFILSNKFTFRKSVALTGRDLQKIGKVVEDVVDKKLDKRFGEFEIKIDKNLDKRFGEFEIKIDKKLDKRFGEFEIKIDKNLDKQFSEHDKKWEVRLDEKFSEYTIHLLELIPTKDELTEKVEGAKEELRDEFRERMVSVQESIVRFHNEWKFGVPPMVKGKLDSYDSAIGCLEKRVGLLENQVEN